MSNTTLMANAVVAMVCLFTAFWVYSADVSRCNASAEVCFQQVNR